MKWTSLQTICRLLQNSVTRSAAHFRRKDSTLPNFQESIHCLRRYKLFLPRAFGFPWSIPWNVVCPYLGLSLASLHARCVSVHFLCILTSGKHIFIADLSIISHLNAKLIISTLAMEQHTFCEPQFK